MATLQPNFVVGIGGSVGGLQAVMTLLQALPSDTGMAFVVVLHLYPTAHSQLAQILCKHTKMTVVLASNAMPIQANHVYVIPANADLFIKGKTLKVVSPRLRRNNQVDLLLLSLAESMGARAIAIILSGYYGDGSEGCKRIKEKGGRVFAQDLSAEVDGMPDSARTSGSVDSVLSPDKMAEKLQQIANGSSTAEPAPPPQRRAPVP